MFWVICQNIFDDLLSHLLILIHFRKQKVVIPKYCIDVYFQQIKFYFHYLSGENIYFWQIIGYLCYYLKNNKCYEAWFSRSSVVYPRLLHYPTQCTTCLSFNYEPQKKWGRITYNVLKVHLSLHIHSSKTEMVLLKTEVLIEICLCFTVQVLTSAPQGFFKPWPDMTHLFQSHS